MPKKKINVSIAFEEATVEFLTDLANQENKSISSLAQELILEALERREDIVLSAIAEIRDAQHTKKIKHDDAWK